MKEVWKITDFKDYEVSNLGNVRSKSRLLYGRSSTGNVFRRNWKGRILRPAKTPDGYLTVSCRHNNSRRIHRLVAKAFIPNPENKPCVNHLSGNKKDNRVQNLAWCTYSENEKWSYDMLGKKATPSAWKKGNIPHNIKKVAQYSLDGKLLNTFESATAAAKHIGTVQSRISCNCVNDTKTCHGFRFEYI